MDSSVMESDTEIENEKSAPLKIKIFDTNLASGCSGCCGGGCSNPVMHEFEVIAVHLMEKYGSDKFRFELYDFFKSHNVDKKIKKLVDEKSEDQLPAIMIDDDLIFTEKMPSLEEFDTEVSKRLASNQ